jgi:hypothetical protein
VLFPSQFCAKPPRPIRGFRFYLPWRTTLETTVVENFGAIENRNSSDVSFHFAFG